MNALIFISPRAENLENDPPEDKNTDLALNEGITFS
jgi:hypothetical protein